MNDKAQLLSHLNKLHTTEMGIDRIKKNLQLHTSDVTAYCRELLLDENCRVYRKGKNLYCETGSVQLTVNAGSYTIITAHMIKSEI